MDIKAKDDLIKSLELMEVHLTKRVVICITLIEGLMTNCKYSQAQKHLARDLIYAGTAGMIPTRFHKNYEQYVKNGRIGGYDESDT